MMQQEQYTNEKGLFNERLYQIDTKDLNSILHRSIGALTFINERRVPSAGSGIIISNELILTAAHNLYDRKEQAENKNFKFYLGACGEADKPLSIDSFRYPEQFKTCKTSQEVIYDYALIKLKGKLAFNQFIKIALPCPDCVVEDKESFLDVYGFPIFPLQYTYHPQNYEAIDKRGEKLRLYQYGLSRQDKIIGLQSQSFTLKYAISTFPGQSGAPLVMNEQIIGIHKAGGKTADEFNIGRLIDRSLLERLQIWAKQLTGGECSWIQKPCCHKFTSTPANLLYEVKDHELKKRIHRSIGSIKFLDRYKRLMCGSGILLSSNMFLTAAQNIFDKDQNTENTDLKVSFGEQGGISKDFYQVQSYRYHDDYKTCEKSKRLKWEYALVKLKKAVEYDKFVKLSLPCPKCIMVQNDTTFTQLFGFPIHKGNHTSKGKGDAVQLVQYGFACKNAIIQFPKLFKINYRLLTMPGEGGSPVIIKNNIIAVHAGSKQKMRIGRFITSDFIESVRKWCKELKGESFQVANEDHICNYVTQEEEKLFTESQLRISRIKQEENEIK